MKKILCAVLALVTVLSMAVAFTSCDKDPEADLKKAYDKIVKDLKFNDADLPTLTVATSPDFAPMEFSDLSKSGQDQYVGFDIILAKYIAKELNMKLVIKPMSFDSCMAAVTSGSADLAISGFSWTALRAETFLISDYYVAGDNETEQFVITTKANADKFKTAESFKDAKVGAQGGSLQELLVSEQLVTKGATMVKMDNLNDLFAALKNGNIDALAVAKGNGDAFISGNEDKICFSGFEFQLEEKYKNNVILLNKNNAALLEKVNAALGKAMSANLYEGWYEACQIYSGIKTADELGYDDQGNKITETK